MPEGSAVPARHAKHPLPPSDNRSVWARAAASSTLRAATAGLFVIAVVTPMSLALPPVGKSADAASTSSSAASGTPTRRSLTTEEMMSSANPAAPISTAPPTTAPASSAAPAPTTAATTSTAPPAAATTAPPAPPAANAPGVLEVLAAINTARSLAGLGPVVADPKLQLSANLHNLAMASAGQLSHQLPGEDTLGARITAVGVVWSYVAENIGVGGGDAGSATAVALSLTQAMLAETPPNDGHRRNILSASVSRVGIDVYVDGKGQIWLTQDFAT